jgi:hypothetical protein
LLKEDSLLDLKTAMDVNPTPSSVDILDVHYYNACNELDRGMDVFATPTLLRCIPVSVVSASRYELRDPFRLRGCGWGEIKADDGWEPFLKFLCRGLGRVMGMLGRSGIYIERCDMG